MDRQWFTRGNRSSALLFALSSLFFGSAAWGDNTPSVDPADTSFHGNTSLAFAVPRLPQSIQVDGKLDEPLWATATRLTNFVEIEPGDNCRPPVETEALVGYDDENLYIGFRCYDDNTGAIRASITDRDRMFGDDFAGVMIDTFRDQTNGYEFFVNPRGIQGDLYRSRNNEDSSYDTVWQSGGQITDLGWTAEIAIPFRSIRFPDSPSQNWGVHVFRNRPRESRAQYSWAPISRDENCFFCQAGEMSGIEGIDQGRNLEVLPYVIGNQSGSMSGDDDASFDWKNEHASGEMGMGVKYGLTPNHTLDFTYNPDFSQIESDATQIDENQTFALFYPEKRPFFLEGADRFSSMIDVVYTRSINDPLSAAKYTGKSGRNTISFITAMDETSPYIVPFEEQSGGAAGRDTYSNVLRYKRDVLKESFVGLIATDRRQRDGNGSNTTAGVDTRLRLDDHFTVWGQVQGSHTQEPHDTIMSEGFNDVAFGDQGQYTGAFDGESFAGYAAEMELARSGRHYNADLWFEDYSPTFRAENGFVTANDYRMVGFWNGYQFQLEKNPVFERIEPQLDAGRKYNYQGEFKDTWLQPNIWLRFKKQTYFWTGYLWSEERFAGVLVPGIHRWVTEMDSEFSKYLSVGFDTRIGHSVVRDRDDPRLGDEFSYALYAYFKPISQVRFDVDYNSFRLDELDGSANIYDTYVVRTKLTYQFSKSLFLRVVGEYVDDQRSLAVDPLLSYKINPFTVFFLGSSHSFNDFQDDPSTAPVEVTDPGYRQTERLFFVKFQYLFRV